jgi:DNA-binding response OmpR family regulator
MARILLIDDDPAVRRMLRLTLCHFGHEVIEACDGNEGLKRFQDEEIDLVITDIVMPGKEGLEVLMDLRKRQPPVIVIAISGGDRRRTGGYLHTAQLMGASRVLEKPFPSEVLIEAINELIPRKGGQENPPEAPTERPLFSIGESSPTTLRRDATSRPTERSAAG